MARKKVDVTAVAREIITLTNNQASSKQITAVLALAGHTINPNSVAALKAWARA